MNLAAALEYGSTRLAHLATARRDAELLLLCAAGKDRAFLLTHPDEELTAAQQSTYEAWIARRARYEPVQYITGRQEFYGLAFEVTPDVLIPRPETEHLIEAVLERAAKDALLHIVDVGTGSGAIAVTLAHALWYASVTALDCSAAALAVAKRNAGHHNVANHIRFLPSNLLEAVAGERFDLIVSNPPYVPENEPLEPQVSGYEPNVALFAGPSGLEIYQRLIPQAHQVLKSGGWLLMEIGYGQREALADLLKTWDEVSFVDDLQGIPRIVCAQRP